MHASRVVYSRLINTGNYENERFECEILLGVDESPEAAFAQAEFILNRQVACRLNEISGVEKPLGPEFLENIPY